MRRSLWALALGLLVIIDAALVAWALRPASGSSSEETPVVTSSSSTTTAPTSSAAAPVGPDRVIVVPRNASSAWRVVTGSSCAGSVSLARSQDSGARWTPGPKVDLKMVSSVSTDDSGTPVLTGLDAACKPATRTLGESGVKATDAKPTWAINPANASTLLHAGTATAKACPSGTIKDLATDTAERANVLCDQGEIRRTVDSGATWSRVGTVKGATGISTASAGQGYRVYVASAQPCGVRVAALAEEATGTATGCVEGSAGAKSVDIAVWGRTIWVADQTKAWIVPTSSPVVSQSSSSTSETSTEMSSSSTQESQVSSTSQAGSSSQQWTPSSTNQWTPTRTRSSTYEPPSSTYTPPVDPTTVEPPASESTGAVAPTSP